MAVLLDVKGVLVEVDDVLHRCSAFVRRFSAVDLDKGQAAVVQPGIAVEAVHPGDPGPGELEVLTAPLTS